MKQPTRSLCSLPPEGVQSAWGGPARTVMDNARPSSKRRRALGAAALSVIVLGACASPKPSDYADQKPVFDLREYFNGPLVAHGMFTDRQGRIVKRFRVDLVGRWQGDRGELSEHFVYSDGTQQDRVWHLQRLPDGRYTGTAADVVGTAQGQAAGNVLNWHYTLRLPVNGSTYDVQFDDWMVLMDHHVMLNRARMSKFGIGLGEITLAFQKP